MHEKIEALLARPRIKQHTNAWFSERKIRLTASDVPAVLGHNPYCTREEVFLRKTNQKKPMEVNAACMYGQKYEALACKAYSVVTGIKCVDEDIGLVTHADFPEFGASPDRVAQDVPVLVEVKCPFRRKIVAGQIPHYYIDQIEFQMACTGLDVVHFVQFIPGGIAKRGTLDITEKPKDPQWWDTHFHTLREFWRDVVKYWEQNPNKKPPRRLQVAPNGVVTEEVAKPQTDGFSMHTDMPFEREYYDITIQPYTKGS